MAAFDFAGVVDRVKLFSDDLGALFAVCVYVAAWVVK